MQCGGYGSALGAAVAHGHRKIKHLLLENGADITMQDGYYGSLSDTSTDSEKESTHNEDEESGEDGENEENEENEWKNEEEQESEQMSRKRVRTEMAGGIDGSDDMEPAAKQQKLPIRTFQIEENAENMDVN